MKDRPQCIAKLFPSFRHGKSVVDYYISHMVFPKEMKEFPHKLSASGWDIGKYLLQPENGVQLMAPVSANNTISDVDYLLSCVMQLCPPVQVILDVEAQIIELDNLEMAKAWLKLHDDSKQAVVFIDMNDEICVVDRSDRVDLLRASSFQSRLDACLVFLDEAHTHGIDLVLLLENRVAVTLGPRLTQDRLVQASKRMRKLGKGQTVVFCVSKEMQTKVLDTARKTDASTITVADILEWSMHETSDDLRRNMPLWAVQAGPKIFAMSDEPVVQQIAARCKEFNITQFKSSALQEEQERELSPEMEQERQIQRAPPAKACPHKLHPDVKNFALTSKVVSSSQGYHPAFSTLRGMSTATAFNPSDLAGEEAFLTTTDFAETVLKGPETFVSDTFLRSVQWILTAHDPDSKTIKTVMILSPYEANSLIRSMEQSEFMTLHLYRARVNSGYAALDSLDFHTIPVRKPALQLPRRLAAHLNLFAGQLYFSSYNDYLETCKVLGLLPRFLSEEMERQGWKVDAAGFILADDRGRVGGESGLTKSPVGFLKGLFTARRNVDGFGKSHVGKLLEGHVLQKADFEA
ncbi:Uu.00g019600.m01.CDS01 [Anthostomella pinea]|uniref:ubiquitinyl hydrolase 1 n=1 Tax=Anthostomella pinea TaxID=933095 RepID=A0AAI8VTH1_9PEZI|nr:Uu.00g019600.m01.CDS01 [Anthostomella pinea]